MVAVMTAGLVVALGAAARGPLINTLEQALNSVR
jgi:hypothetical protein